MRWSDVWTYGDMKLWSLFLSLSNSTANHPPPPPPPPHTHTHTLCIHVPEVLVALYPL